MKRILAMMLSLCMCMAMFVGCSGDKPATSAEVVIADSGEFGGETDKQIIVGLDDTFAPMGFRDTDGKLVGFDIDLAVEVAKTLGVDVKFKPIDWDSKEMELSSKRIDCIWNGMSATPERQESMSLTKKYFNNKIIIMSLNSEINIKSADELKNYNIGTQKDSAALETMVANDAYDSFKDKISQYKSYDDAILDMKAGRIDCVVIDQVLGEYKNSKATEKMAVSEFNFGDDFYAIGCRKEEPEFAEKINSALQTLIDNGKAAEISEKWFGKDLVILEAY